MCSSSDGFMVTMDASTGQRHGIKVIRDRISPHSIYIVIKLSEEML